jgi:hypothetical protein
MHSPAVQCSQQEWKELSLGASNEEHELQLSIPFHFYHDGGRKGQDTFLLEIITLSFSSLQPQFA